MPNLFLSGNATFTVTGNKEQVDDVMSDVERGWSNISVDYDDNGISCTIEFRLSEKVGGIFDFERTSDTTIKVTIDGIIKTSARTSAITALIDNATDWKIDSVSGGSRSIFTKPAPDTSGLKLTKKAPKT